MKLWILRRLTWFSLRCGIYYLWSRIYQRLFESTWLDYTKVPLFPSVGAIEDCVEKMKWRPDKWWMFWDAVSAPGAVWARYFEGKEAGDCEDVSLAAATALREWLRHHRMHVEVTGLYLLTVPWLGRDGKVGGHSVCAISYVDVDGTKKWAHWSNWNRILWGRETVEDVVREILRGNYSLGWALADLDLRLVRYGGWENP